MHSHDSSTRRTARRRSRCAGLIALNAVLLGVLAFVSLGPQVGAQAARTRGDYLMVAGHVNGVDGSAVYIVDAVNQEMIALSLNNTSKTLEGIGHRNLANDARSLPGGRN